MMIDFWYVACNYVSECDGSVNVLAEESVKAFLMDEVVVVDRRVSCGRSGFV